MHFQPHPTYATRRDTFYQKKTNYDVYIFSDFLYHPQGVRYLCFCTFEKDKNTILKYKLTFPDIFLFYISLIFCMRLCIHISYGTHIV